MTDIFGKMLGCGLTKSEIYDLVSRIECDLLITIFIVLKLTGHIDWAWWSIFTPAYILGIINILNLYLNKGNK